MCYNLLPGSLQVWKNTSFFFFFSKYEFYKIWHFWVIQEMYSLYGHVLCNESLLRQLLYSVQKFKMGVVLPESVSKLNYDGDVKVIY